MFRITINVRWLGAIIFCLCVLIVNTACAAGVNDATSAAISVQCEAQAAAVHSVWWPRVQQAVEQGNVQEARMAACGDGSKDNVLIDCLNQYYQIVSPVEMMRIRMQVRAELIAHGMKPCLY